MFRPLLTALLCLGLSACGKSDADYIAETEAEVARLEAKAAESAAAAEIARRREDLKLAAYNRATAEIGRLEESHARRKAAGDPDFAGALAIDRAIRARDEAWKAP